MNLSSEETNPVNGWISDLESGTCPIPRCGSSKKMAADFAGIALRCRRRRGMRLRRCTKSGSRRRRGGCFGRFLWAGPGASFQVEGVSEGGNSGDPKLDFAFFLGFLNKGAKGSTKNTHPLQAQSKGAI